MALSKKLRDDICKRLHIKQAAYYKRVRAKYSESGAPDMDTAALLLGQELGIDVSKPRYEVPPEKIQAFREFLGSRVRTTVLTPIGSPTKSKRRLVSKTVPIKPLLNLRGKYPDIFFERLEQEINIAHSNPELPNAVVMLSRKLIENLVYRLMQMQFHGVNIQLYFDTNHNRPFDFSILLDNLKEHKRDFPVDMTDTIDRFLAYADSFRVKANANTHNVLDYLDKMRQVDQYKIREMTQLLLNLIERIR